MFLLNPLIKSHLPSQINRHGIFHLIQNAAISISLKQIHIINFLIFQQQIRSLPNAFPGLYLYAVSFIVDPADHKEVNFTFLVCSKIRRDTCALQLRYIFQSVQIYKVLIQNPGSRRCIRTRHPQEYLSNSNIPEIEPAIKGNVQPISMIHLTAIPDDMRAV